MEIFKQEEENQFEWFKQSDIQQIILYILNDEFDLDYYRNEKIIILLQLWFACRLLDRLHL